MSVCMYKILKGKKCGIEGISKASPLRHPLNKTSLPEE